MNHQLKIILAIVCLCNLSFAQELAKTETVDGFEKKILEINKIEKAPKIDGVLDDVAWQNATIATNFTERRPENGAKVPDSIRTEVKVVYTDRGVYFGAKMYDPNPESIPRELTEREARRFHRSVDHPIAVYCSKLSGIQTIFPAILWLPCRLRSVYRVASSQRPNRVL